MAGHGPGHWVNKETSWPMFWTERWTAGDPTDECRRVKWPMKNQRALGQVCYLDGVQLELQGNFVLCLTNPQTALTLCSVWLYEL